VLRPRVSKTWPAEARQRSRHQGTEIITGSANTPPGDPVSPILAGQRLWPGVRVGSRFGMYPATEIALRLPLRLRSSATGSSHPQRPDSGPPRSAPTCSPTTQPSRTRSLRSRSQGRRSRTATAGRPPGHNEARPSPRRKGLALVVAEDDDASGRQDLRPCTREWGVRQ
jgi:hypothetical protein